MLPYNPFERLSLDMVNLLVQQGRHFTVVQRFRWPGVPENKGFMLSPYQQQGDAEAHLLKLQKNEGKCLNLSLEDDLNRLTALFDPEGEYQLFYIATKDTAVADHLTKHFGTRINAYVKSKMPYGKFDLGFKVEAGTLMATITFASHATRLPFYELIK